MFLIQGNLNDNTQSIEQDKYINQIVKLTRLCNSNLFNSESMPVASFNNSNSTQPSTTHTNNINTYKQTNSSSISEVVACGNGITGNSHKTYSVTPTTNRRSLFASKIEKAVQTIKNNYNMNNASISSSSSENINPTHLATPHNINTINNIHSKCLFLIFYLSSKKLLRNFGEF